MITNVIQLAMLPDDDLNALFFTSNNSMSSSMSNDGVIKWCSSNRAIKSTKKLFSTSHIT